MDVNPQYRTTAARALLDAISVMEDIDTDPKLPNGTRCWRSIRSDST